MSDLEILEFLEDDIDSDEKQQARLARRGLRNSVDPYDMPDDVFIARYRLSKDLALELSRELRRFLPRRLKSSDLTVDVKLLIALSFYAAGAYQRPTGDIAAHSVAQQTVSAVVSQITKCLNLPYFKQKYIKFPSNTEELNGNISRYLSKYGIPGVIGCIGGTHIKIIRPRENENCYFNKKKYYSLNVQLICDADMQIIDVDATHGGTTHDAFIWSKNPLNDFKEQDNMWLLGHSGYPLRKSMMTPVDNPSQDSPEENYNRVHNQTRTILEHTVRALKARFRCLLGTKALYYKPPIAASMINACVVLHNICNEANVPVPTLTAEEIAQEAKLQLPIYQPLPEEISGNISHRAALEKGIVTRQLLIDHLWELQMINGC